MLPAGDYRFLYFARSDASVVKGTDGRDNAGFAKFTLKSDALALRYQHVWGPRLLGAGLESVGAVPFVTAQLTKVTAGGASVGNTTNMGDPLLVPLRASWKGDVVSQAASLEFIAPLGAYGKANVLNAGRNYWQIAPTYAVSVRPVPGLEAKVKARYGFNTRNADTDYQSGDELTVEYLAGYKVEPATTLGLSGYYYRQTTDDKLHGDATVSNLPPSKGGLPGTGTGNRGEVTAIGPCVTHVFSKSFMIVMKYQQEFNARNRAQGSRLWIQMPF
jgi:hypothetical protein